MKKLLFITIAIFTVASFLTCQKKQPTGPDSKQDEPVKTINENAVFIDPTKTSITVAEVDSTTFVRPLFKLQIDGEIPELKVGSVIVDTTGMGKIYVVTKTSLGKGTGLIEVFQGTIDFLFQNSDLKVATPKNRTKETTQKISNKLPLVTNQIYGKINNVEYSHPFDSEQLKYKADFSNQTIMQDPNGLWAIKIVEGQFSLNPAIDYHAIYSNRDLALGIINPTLSIGALQYLRLISYSDLDFNLKIRIFASTSHNIIDRTTEIATYWHPIPIGPLVLSVKISLKARLNMNIQAAMDITAGYQTKINAVAGIEVPNGPFSAPVYFDEFNKIEENITAPKVESDFSFAERFEIIPEIEVYLYGILGANGEIIPYQEFNFNAHSINELVDWDCELAIGVDGYVSLDVSAFHFDELTMPILNMPLPGSRAVLYSAPHLEMLSGNNQQGTKGQQLQNPFRVRALDNLGNEILAPVNVYWNVKEGNGSLKSNNTYYAKPPGYAENYLTLGSNATTNKAAAYLKKANGSLHNENVFTAIGTEAPYITVTAPNGGESWQLGSTHTITWSSNTGGNVKIELYKDSNYYKTITSSTSNNGSYSWSIPTNYDLYNSYRVRITSTGNASLYDDSNGYFSLTAIPQPIISVAPASLNFGDVNAGSSKDLPLRISNTGNAALDVTNISSSNSQFSVVGSTSFNVAAGSYRDITVRFSPNSPGYKSGTLRINNNSSENPKNVPMDGTGTEGSYITVTVPNGGENWQLGSTQTITWTSNASGNVKIELYKGSNFYQTITNSTANNGSFSWSIPTNYDTYNNYLIKITSTTNASLYDDSDDYFGLTVVSTDIDWVSVPGGTFQMGDTFGDGFSDEKPVHTVTLSSFQMSKYEVTNSQYAAFLNAYGSANVKSGEYAGKTMIYEHDWGVKRIGGNWQPATGKENHPVIYVTWYGAYEFCRFYSWRLPTEAEWEYAARSGGKSEKWAGTSDVNRLGEYAWYNSNSGDMTHAVGEKKPNGLGLYDMSGNVWEWCNDWYGSNYYSSSPTNNPPGPATGNYRVLRGGSWVNNEHSLRCSHRHSIYPFFRDIYFGFRLVR